MHSPSALMEHVSWNLAMFFLLHPVFACLNHDWLPNKFSWKFFQRLTCVTDMTCSAMVGAAFPLPLPPPPMVRLPSIGGGGNSHVPSSGCAFPPCSLPDSLTIFSSPKLHLPPPSTDPPLKGLPAMPPPSPSPLPSPRARTRSANGR